LYPVEYQPGWHTASIELLACNIAPDNVAQGSTVCPGTPLVDDANDWKVLIPFLDVDSWDWEGFAQQNKEYLDVDVPIQMP
jgi:hypothetical protein